MYLKFFAFGLLCISLNASAQKNAVDAIVVRTNGDSVAGKIDYRNWKRNPETVHFTANSGGTETLHPTAVSSFYIVGEKERYVSYEVAIDQGTDQYNKAYNSHLESDNFVTKKVFLLQLVTDPALSLYQYNDGTRDNFYYVPADGKPVGLIYHFLYVETGDQVRTDDSYKQQLAVLFASCPEIAKKTSTITYSSESLKRITGQYLSCSNPGHVADIKKPDAEPVKFGIVGGIMYNTYNFKGKVARDPVNYSTINLDNYKGNLSPVLGAAMDIALSRNRNKWHLVNELIYKQYVTSDTGFTHTVLYDVNNEVSFSFGYLQINTIVRYFFETKNTINPFINAGIGNAYMIAERKNDNHVKTTSGTDKNYVAIDGVRKYELTPLIGAGIRVKNITTEARFSYGNGFSSYINFKSRVASYQLVATYYF